MTPEQDLQSSAATPAYSASQVRYAEVLEQEVLEAEHLVGPGLGRSGWAYVAVTEQRRRSRLVRMAGRRGPDDTVGGVAVTRSDRPHRQVADQVVGLREALGVCGSRATAVGVAVDVFVLVERSARARSAGRPVAVENELAQHPVEAAFPGVHREQAAVERVADQPACPGGLRGGELAGQSGRQDAVVAAV